ncbi:hypothetical protein [Desulforhopalus sp. 52FAK]
MILVCEVCGNEIENSVSVCPYCGNKNEADVNSRSAGYSHKTINLEMGRPVLEAALTRMVEAVADAKRNGVNVITLIHGYGSSGKGGVIRTECRKSLDFMKTKGQINDFIFGEDFSKRAAPMKNLLRRYPDLSSHQHINRENKGITLVILT